MPNEDNPEFLTLAAELRQDNPGFTVEQAFSAAQQIMEHLTAHADEWMLTQRRQQTSVLTHYAKEWDADVRFCRVRVGR